MVCDQLPAQIKILIKQNYQHNVVPDDENHSTHTWSTQVFVLLALPHAHLKDMHWARTCGPARLPPGIPPKPLLEHTLDLGHQLSSALGGPAVRKRGKQFYECHINQLKINY